MENNDFDRYIQSIRQDKKLEYEPVRLAIRLAIGSCLGAASGLVFGTTLYSFNHLIQLPILRMHLGLFDLILRVISFTLIGAIIGLVTNWMSEWLMGILLGEIFLIIGLEVQAYFLPEATARILSTFLNNNAYFLLLAIAAVGMKALYSLPITLSLRFVTNYQIENRNNHRSYWKRIMLVTLVLIAAGLLGAFLPGL